MSVCSAGGGTTLARTSLECRGAGGGVFVLQWKKWAEVYATSGRRTPKKGECISRVIKGRPTSDNSGGMNDLAGKRGSLLNDWRATTLPQSVQRQGHDCTKERGGGLMGEGSWRVDRPRQTELIEGALARCVDRWRDDNMGGEVIFSECCINEVMYHIWQC